MLTAKQFICASLITEGKTSKEIGKILNISYRTVEDCIANVKIKFQCKNKTALVGKLITYGVIEHYSNTSEMGGRV